MSQAARKPRLVLLVGGNGAGKTTFYKTFLEPRGLAFINADVVAKEFWPDNPEAHSYDAMRLVEKSRKDALSHGRSFCFETVFSHESKVEFIQEAREHGYEVQLYYIHLDNPDLNVLRVRHRITEGGHSVPEDKIQSRIPRTLANLKHAIELVDRLVLLDNSRHDDPYRVQAILKNGAVVQRSEELARWARDLLAEIG